MRPGLLVPYWVGLVSALVVAQTQLDGAQRLLAVGAVTLALALLSTWQLERMLAARRRELALREYCGECGYTRRGHRDDRCPGGDDGDTFTRDQFGLAR